MADDLNEVPATLSPRGRLVLHTLITLAGPAHLAYPSLDHLQHLTGLRRRTLQRALVRLRHSHHLQITPRFCLDGTQCTNRYEVMHHD